jgi:hypothetical protein
LYGFFGITTSGKENDMRFGTWNVRSLYRAGSLATVAQEIAKYKSDLGEYRRSDGAQVARN